MATNGHESTAFAQHTSILHVCVMVRVREVQQMFQIDISNVSRYYDVLMFFFLCAVATEMCVFVIKELLRYYMKHGSCMYVAFLDASKAFDRVNHTKLFSKLLKLGVPKWIIKVLVQWYCNQSMCVRWGSAFSDFFLVNNGVRQGGILSPLLFNVYINELSESLSKLPVGCCCGNTVVNHLMYADDIVLFAPSAKGLQRIINVCYAYGCDNDNI